LALLALLHQRFAVALIAFAFILALWGTLQFLLRRSISPGFRSSYLLMIALTAAQGILGVIALALGGRPRELLHVVYGIFAIVFLTAIYLWTARGDRTREAAFMAASCWIVVIAYYRGVVTGQ
jgi:heme A synthase